MSKNLAELAPAGENGIIFHRDMRMGEKTAQARSGGILSHRLKIVRTAGCHLLVRKFHRIFRQQKCLSSPKLRDERHTAFRGTTQIRRKALRTRFPITEDDPAAHFLTAAPGRTPQTATGQLAAGD